MELLLTRMDDERGSSTSVPSRAAHVIRGIGVRQVRIACGLVMFSYLVSHFFNHALGNISYAAMEAWLWYHIWWWRTPAVNLTLYAAATTHFALGLWALYQRRHFRYTAREVTQLVLGLSVPILLMAHLGGVRLTGPLFGRPPPNYATPLFGYWNMRTYMIWVQYAVLTVAWMHACIGLYFWLRLKPFFRWASPILLAIAVLLPPLAMLGLHQGAREVTRLGAEPQWRASNLRPLPPPQRDLVDSLTFYFFPFGYFALLGLVFAARGVRGLVERRGGLITVSYPERQVRVPKGLSVLETSLRFKIPHASVCGGRARCSTCRVRVVSDSSKLPRPSGREMHVLARVRASADPAIRLACQLRPVADIAVIPLLPPNVGADFVRNRRPIRIGEERYIVSMFVDMRGSTKFAEKRLPFDVVFLVNRFLSAASQAVLDAGGQPNQFLGDGLLGLFGLNVDPATACRQALRAAALVAANMEYLNHQFASDLPQSIEFGIGIHGGEVIIGDIGFRDHTVFTALGDAVNVAARLQDATKTLNCVVVVSEDVCKTAGLDCRPLSRTELPIRGHEEPLAVLTTSDPTVLTSLLEAEPASPEAERVSRVEA
jgi:adenylate cyclase